MYNNNGPGWTRPVFPGPGQNMQRAIDHRIRTDRSGRMDGWAENLETMSSHNTFKCEICKGRILQI